MLLECLTHRLRGHYEGDPAKYRDALAKEEWREKDPIVRLTRRGVAEGWFTDEDAAAAGRAAAEAVDAAVAFARASPFPPPGLAEELVYA
jgi:pyruvate dehydrogenase E1 component alpha subunit